MMKLSKQVALPCVAVALAACSTTTSDDTTASVGQQVETSPIQMEVTDIDYSSLKTDISYKVSYSFPDDGGQLKTYLKPNKELQKSK